MKSLDSFRSAVASIRTLHRVSLAAACVALLVASASMVAAQHGSHQGSGPHAMHGSRAGTGHVPGHGTGFDLNALHGAMAHALSMVDLDESQQAAMQSLHQRFAPALEEFHQASESLHGDLFEAAHGDDFDVATVRSAAADFARLQEDLFVATAEMMYELRNLLTDEQLQKVHELHEMHEMHQKGQGHGGPKLRHGNAGSGR